MTSTNVCLKCETYLLLAFLGVILPKFSIDIVLSVIFLRPIGTHIWLFAFTRELEGRTGELLMNVIRLQEPTPDRLTARIQLSLDHNFLLVIIMTLANNPLVFHKKI